MKPDQALLNIGARQAMKAKRMTCSPCRAHKPKRRKHHINQAVRKR